MVNENPHLLLSVVVFGLIVPALLRTSQSMTPIHVDIYVSLNPYVFCIAMYAKSTIAMGLRSTKEHHLPSNTPPAGRWKY